MGTEITLREYKAAVAARVKEVDPAQLGFVDRTRLNEICRDIMQVLWDLVRDEYEDWQDLLIKSHSTSNLRRFCQQALAKVHEYLGLRVVQPA